MALGPGWFVPVLIGQSVILAAAGERTPVLADAIAVIVLMCHAGMRPSGRQLRVAAAVAVLAALAITGVRELGKRGIYEEDSSLGKRVSGLATGPAALPGRPAQEGPGPAGWICTTALGGNRDGEGRSEAITSPVRPRPGRRP